MKLFFPPHSRGSQYDPPHGQSSLQNLHSTSNSRTKQLRQSHNVQPFMAISDSFWHLNDNYSWDDIFDMIDSLFLDGTLL